MTEEVFENERLYPLKGWRGPSSTIPGDPPRWSTITGELHDKDSIDVDEGWLWENDWTVDTTRAGDKDGWEYAFSFGSEFFPCMSGKGGGGHALCSHVRFSLYLRSQETHPRCAPPPLDKDAYPRPRLRAPKDDCSGKLWLFFEIWQPHFFLLTQPSLLKRRYLRTLRAGCMPEGFTVIFICRNGGATLCEAAAGSASASAIPILTHSPWNPSTKSRWVCLLPVVKPSVKKQHG